LNEGLLSKLLKLQVRGFLACVSVTSALTAAISTIRPRLTDDDPRKT
jgi:hypothetical protein